jgi:predicted SAM-dependent methyltransferase
MTRTDLSSTLGKDRLHIGGKTVKEGWKLLNIKAMEGADYIGDIRDLSLFADASFDAVYASHVLEHVSYQKALGNVALSIHRILRPGGKFLVSVPDLDILCRMFLHEKATLDDRFFVMRMMFGGQVDEHDFHFVGLNAEFLTHCLQQAGFREIHRVPEFKIFKDTSSMRYKGVLISLNMVAIK